MTHENAHAGQGAVLLDIGGDVGALVVEMPPSLEGQEVEIRPARGAEPRPGHHGHEDAPPPRHAAVVARPTGAGAVCSLVFPGLAGGEYRLNVRGETTVLLTVTVEGGRVSEARWPG